MTRSVNSCGSLLQLQHLKATGVVVLLLLSLGSVDAYRGVSKRKDGPFFHCETTFSGSFPREKVWVGTFPTEALAALACDVAFFYTKSPSTEFNLEYSEDAIFRNCKPRSAYASLRSWNERRIFIKAEANALINLMSSEGQAPDFRWEDVAVSPFVPVRQRSDDVAWTIVEHFRSQAEWLREFMAWLMRLSNTATQSIHEGRALGHVQTFLQQQREEPISQLDTDDVLLLGGDSFLDAARVTLLLDSVEARPGCNLWLALVASSLPLLFQMFSRTNVRDNKGVSINANDATFTEKERHQSHAERATKRQKANHPSVELNPDQENSFTSIHFGVKGKTWLCTGYDTRSKSWRTLSDFSYLATPDEDCYRCYSVCGHESLMCINVSEVGAELVVFNPLTGKKRTLPPLLYPRHPVLMHMLVDSATNSYKVIVAGSSSLGEGHLSKKLEMFDSKTSKWEELCDLQGPVFGLNEYQTGVCVNGVLYFLSFLEDDVEKGVVAFDVENGKWLPKMACPIPCSSSSTMLQLVENNGEVYLFYEKEAKRCYTRCIDVLEISNSASGEVTCHWRNMVQMNCDRKGLEIFPEYMCVGFGEGKLCVFDNLELGGVVYDMRSGRVCEVLEQRTRGNIPYLFPHNPVSFTLQLSSDSDPFPPNVDDVQVAVTLLQHPSLQ